MRLTIFAIGRMKQGPERELCERYLDRAIKSGKPLGFTRLDQREWDESRQPRTDDRKAEEARLMLAALPPGAVLVALDERGKSPSSPDFAARIGTWRDSGVGDLVFAIGGPDGHGEDLRARADWLVSFGALTFPHQLVRLLIAEQLYRTTTILSGHPYHRT